MYQEANAPQRNFGELRGVGAIGCDAVNRDPAVPSALRNMKAGTEILHDVLSNLESRLSPVMTKALTEKGCGEGMLSNCEMVGAIHECHAGVNSAIQRIQSLLQRLEI